MYRERDVYIYVYIYIYNIKSYGEVLSWLHFSICAYHPCAGAMLIFSVSFQF